jgi:hypothetical protein
MPCAPCYWHSTPRENGRAIFQCSHASNIAYGYFAAHHPKRRDHWTASRQALISAARHLVARQPRSLMGWGKPVSGRAVRRQMVAMETPSTPATCLTESNESTIRIPAPVWGSKDHAKPMRKGRLTVRPCRAANVRRIAPACTPCSPGKMHAPWQGRTGLRLVALYCAAMRRARTKMEQKDVTLHHLRETN